ncbi:hypothetical protein COCMIDRAFT_6553 [Bipolaris oryzae ATCC 44560]|uniref:EthD domain-containing protein n=1 Tax=Bipolaris oryzae ATCC 44560 TaxID=930090 RepID=W6Z249_COCMI|nr:uncharacterized protein COCMIDRAFT_6553 [Bipolaris oryzae ATCC 44560]EUC44065.1 hypothetical protein COCMIDRAFT_6553 [Bipolaris oryzae ATCC 44560]
MSITQLLTLTLPPTTPNSTLLTLKQSKPPQNYSLGTHIHPPTTLQLTSSHPDINAATSSLTPTTPYLSTIFSTLGQPQKTHHVAFSNGTPNFSEKGAMASPLVEFVKVLFPVARATPEFRRGIERDFRVFDEKCVAVARGNGGVAFGWGVDEEEADEGEIEGGKAVGFFVVRGWERMGCFEELVATDEFKGAIEGLKAWEVPMEMWFVEREG